MTAILRQLLCKRCQAQWFPRSQQPPKACPRCNSRVYMYTYKERPSKRIPTRMKATYDAA